MQMSDNALCEMAQIGLELIPWPANSPDLNLIQTIWFKIKQHLKAYVDCPTRIQPLGDELKTE